MATFEDAAEELMLKLRGLEDEISESEQRLEDLTGRMVSVKEDLEEDWNDLTESVESFLKKVGEESDELDQHADTTLQAVNDAHNAVGENATNARNEIGQAVADLDALGQQANGHAENVEPLVHDGVETPAQSLEARAKELETELGKLVDEARDFLTGDVVPALEQLATDVTERCEALQKSLAEERAEPLQHVFDEWSGHIDELESYVLTQGYESSHQHALDVVEYVMDECETASRAKIESLTQVVSLLEGQLARFATEMERAGKDLTDQAGARLLRELDEAKDAAERAVSGLDRVKQELASRSFMDA